MNYQLDISPEFAYLERIVQLGIDNIYDITISQQHKREFFNNRKERLVLDLHVELNSAEFFSEDSPRLISTDPFILFKRFIDKLTNEQISNLYSHCKLMESMLEELLLKRS